MNNKFPANSACCSSRQQSLNLHGPLRDSLRRLVKGESLGWKEDSLADDISSIAAKLISEWEMPTRPLEEQPVFQSGMAELKTPQVKQIYHPLYPGALQPLCRRPSILFFLVFFMQAISE